LRLWEERGGDEETKEGRWEEAAEVDGEVRCLDRKIDARPGAKKEIIKIRNQKSKNRTK
jgi:hypothetical protein